MKEFPSFEKKSLEGQKIEKRPKKKKDGDPKMSRRSFLKWGAAVGVTVATGGVARELMKSAEKDKQAKKQKEQPESVDEHDEVVHEESAEEEDITVVEQEVSQKAEEENEEKKTKLSSVEKIEAGLESVDPKQKVKVKVKVGEELKTKEVTLEEWAQLSWKIKRLKEVKRIYQGRLEKIARETGLTPELIAGIVTQESNGNPKALSKKRVFSKKQGKYIKVPFARGLMQITPDKKEKYKIKNIFHPYENMLGGSKHLKELIDMYGDLDYAISAYNLGVTGLKRRISKGFDPSQHHYVKKVKYLASMFDGDNDEL